ncbi:poly polymerase catalytic domain-domain-containing protein [Microdochium bolleyi]|uniref:Poly [ADP-ribose] polymerase n=1 Tax=Microdochium bolleyi TaxID=196109 RepID=A0A136IL23_9PEZI|nr:poly polymerase catalytic domain-domain-containing protein [Microdochium bolleyi]
MMEQGWLPDAPGTINPAKLIPGAIPPSLPTPPPTPEAASTFSSSVRDGYSQASAADDPSREQKQLASVLQQRRHAARRSRLPRISSDVEVIPTAACTRFAQDAVQARQLWLEFDQCCGHCVDRDVVQKAGCSVSASAMHKDYFGRQMRRGNKVVCLLDPDAGPDCRVAVESSTRTIWDAYLLRADAASNINYFRRQQITYDKVARTYTLWVREGCVGQPGQLITDTRLVASSATLRPLSARFKSLFRSATGQVWDQRYSERRGRLPSEQYEFVELDYGQHLTQPELPDYMDLNKTVLDEVRTLMDLMLHGGTDKESKSDCESQENKQTWSSYTAPYRQLSHSTIFIGFQILKHIQSLLESADCSLRWKTMQRLTSRYRSRIPHCRVSQHFMPVISSYQALFLELRLLSSLWPEQQEISRAMIAVCDRATMHWQTHGVLAQPLYQAYSSLRHGFRRLTDYASTEYRELCRYLFGSNHPVHRMRFEVQDIYRVFVKAGLSNGYEDWIESGKGVDPSGTGTGAQGDAEERLLLWHGTPLDSLLGILDLGLQIRRRGANFTGTMFGNGIYLADSSSKSAGFCRHHQNLNTMASGPSSITGRRQRRSRMTEGAEAVLLLCEADVGKNRLQSPHSIPLGHSIIEASQGRRRCIQGLGQNGPAAWKGVGWDIPAAPAARAGEVQMPDTTSSYGAPCFGRGLRFNEYVVYNPSHLTIRYLFRLKIRGPGC